ncbi:hypothetical protein, partial [Azotobacter beijerinckii]|uniref:hypothetical protein n=1 Tax=Azotobacter beijerinckii TaxID=170623 RepID=UPI001C31BD49
PNGRRMTTTAEQAGAPPIQSGRAGVGATANGTPMTARDCDPDPRRFSGDGPAAFRRISDFGLCSLPKKD